MVFIVSTITRVLPKYSTITRFSPQKKPNSLSVLLKRYIANIRSHKRGDQGGPRGGGEGGKSFMLYAPPRTQHTDAAFQVPPDSPCKLFPKQQTLAAKPCCFLFSPFSPLQPACVSSRLVRAQHCPASPTP